MKLTFLTAVLLPLVACLDTAPIPTNTPPSAAPGEGSGVGNDSSNDPTAVTPGFSAERPCGDDTVAIVADGDTSVTFCVVNGHEMLGEDQPLGTRSKLRSLGLDLRNQCGSEIFHAIAPDRPIPQALLDACAARPPITSTRSRPHRDPVPEETELASSYCGAGSKNDFITERCDTLPGCLGDCSNWCFAELIGWHQMTMSTQIHDEGDFGEDIVASCGGDTRFRAFLADDTGDPWITRQDRPITAGHWFQWSVIAGGEDIDVRVRGDSETGASHRAAGQYDDY